MSKKVRRLVATGPTFSPWFCGGDYALTKLLKDIKISYEQSQEEETVSGFVTYAIAYSAETVLKLRLYERLSRSPFRILMEFGTRSEVHREIKRIESAYHQLFKKWFDEFERKLIQAFPERDQLVTELRRAKHQGIYNKFFYRDLEDDFQLGIDALLQTLESNISTLSVSSNLLDFAQMGVSRDESDLKADSVVDDLNPVVLSDRIRWTGNKNLLIDIFKIFGRLNLISPIDVERRADLIVAHFSDEKGMALSRSSLIELDRIAKNNNTPHHRGRPKKGPVIEAEIKRDMEKYQSVPED